MLGTFAPDASGQTRKPAPRPQAKPFQFLPDTTVMARVGDRTITARQFVEAYFSSYAEHRPRPDSAGRAQFLQTMIDKEVLARVAREARRPESFEDRAVMRAHTQRVLGNVLYQRAVVDSVKVDEAEVRTLFQQMNRELQLDRVRFTSRQAAERARTDLVAKRISWEQATALRGRLPGETHLGWQRRVTMPVAIASELYALPVQGISSVIAEPPNYAIYRVESHRKSQIPIHRIDVEEDMRARAIHGRSQLLLEQLAAEIGLRYDSLNVAWAASKFPAKFRGGGTSEVVIDVTTPEFAPEDTVRVLATYDGGRVTVGGLLAGIRSIPEIQRPSLDSQAAIRRQIEGQLLEPRMAEVARKRGLDRDPMAISLIERRREEIMMDHLYQDSVMTKVFVPPDARRKYYRENEHRFVTEPNARYALFHVRSQADFDSITARLRRGIRAEDIVRADSIAGLKRGVIETRRQDETGRPYHRELFEQMKEGEIITVGPDTLGTYNVVQLLSLDAGRKVGFEEADAQIDEHLQQEMAEKLLSELTARHRRRVKITARPELVMRVRFVDPTL